VVSSVLQRPANGDDELTLLELADRLLNRGVVITGEAVISVAGVDLIYLGLNVVLTAAENLLRPPHDDAAAARDRSA
jgi:gas vesicle structural protein